MTPASKGRMVAMLVTLPCTAGRMCFICQLTSVLTGAVCAVISVKYISQLGNVGKITPVQCLTNHIIKTSLHIHKKNNFIPYLKTAVNTFQTSLFHNNNNNMKIQTNLEHKLSKTNWKHITAAYISGLLSCDVNYLYYNSSHFCQVHNYLGEVFFRKMI